MKEQTTNKRLIKLILLLALFCHAGYSQDNVQKKAKVNMLEFLTEVGSWDIKHKRPGDGFQKMEYASGYEDTGRKAIFKFSCWPFKQDEMVDELKSRKSTKDTRLIDTFWAFKEGRDPLFFWVGETDMTDSITIGHMISIVTVVKMTDNVIAMVVGLYQKDDDKLMRRKFIDYSFSVRRN